MAEITSSGEQDIERPDGPPETEVLLRRIVGMLASGTYPAISDIRNAGVNLNVISTRHPEHRHLAALAQRLIKLPQPLGIAVREASLQLDMEEPQGELFAPEDMPKPRTRRVSRGQPEATSVQELLF